MDGLFRKSTHTPLILAGADSMCSDTHHPSEMSRGTNAPQKLDEDSHLQLRIPIYLASDCPGDSFCDTMRANELQSLANERKEFHTCASTHYGTTSVHDLPGLKRSVSAQGGVAGTKDFGTAGHPHGITSCLSFLGLRPAKPYENPSEVTCRQVGAARSNGQWISRGRRFV